ncbi:SRR1-like protein [Gadus chalcogrammus]|uniref:SRR1-like protein n=1 Tax=Gadus chalcogrammus TaxID=1042646 RepID=UPI0024C4DE33|nr:SRR1-like protein [Gadus chalcogrammus]
MSEKAEEWQVARRRKGTPRRSKALQVSLTPQGQGCCQDEFNTNKTLLRIRETMSELRCEDFWLDWKKRLLSSSATAAAAPSPDGGAPELPVDQQEEGSVGTTAPGLECVCYGLGSFSSCVSARYQLAMMLLLLEALEIPPRLCWVFDPVFSAGEKEVLRELDLSVLTENEEGKRLTKRPTIFYLMHCGKALYNNLLWRNWERETLPLLTIIGNSFSGIQERTVERELRRDYLFLHQAVALCEERPLPCPPRLQDVFNDTALITFPPGRLSQLPQCTWAEAAEPRYEHCPDLEIIRREEEQGRS